MPNRNTPYTQSVDGGATGSIGWGNVNRVIDLSDTVVYTRYPLPYEFEDSEVHLTAEAPIGTPLTSLEGLGPVRLEARKAN